MIIGTEITKTYGKNEERSNALNHVSITIGDGEFVAVMGPSGCGKSTLLFSLSGTDDINSGSIKLNNDELSTLKENDLADLRRQKMGFVFQQPTMLKNLNLLDNIVLPALQGRAKNIDTIVGRAKGLMKQTGIEDLAKRDITEVSGGQLQRAGICRALINSPEILFADEPTGALNSKSADEIMELLSEVNKKGTAIMLVTHDVRVAARAKRILFMKDGQIIHQMEMTKHSDTDIQEKKELISKQMFELEI